MMERRIVSWILAVVLGATVSSCAQSGARDASGGSRGQGAQGASPVVSPLSIKVASPSRLATISALRILPPAIAPSVANPSVTAQGLEELLVRRADEAMSMKVVAATAAGKTDAVLRTEVLTYQEREGSKFGGEPAAVSFVMTVTRSSDGAEVWQANYFFRQEALSDNWLKIGQRYGSNGTGSGWLSARELLDRGLSAAFADFATRRDDQFVRPRAAG